MTREEHKTAYEEHSKRATELTRAIAHGSVLGTVQQHLCKEYVDELTAASAHLALSMLLAEVEP